MSFAPPSLTINTIGYAQMRVTNERPKEVQFNFFDRYGQAQNVEPLGDWSMSFYQSKTNTNALYTVEGIATNNKVSFNVVTDVSPSLLTFQVKSGDTPRIYGSVQIPPVSTTFHLLTSPQEDTLRTTDGYNIAYT